MKPISGHDLKYSENSLHEFGALGLFGFEPVAIGFRLTLQHQSGANFGATVTRQLKTQNLWLSRKMRDFHSDNAHR